MSFDRTLFPFFSKELIQELENNSIVKEFPKGTEILKEEQYIKVLPIVISGLVKVFSRYNDKELLLYYIEPSQSCVMTFYSVLKNSPSKIFAITETDSKILLIPILLVPKWLKIYPEFNELFYNQYNLRYVELLDTIGNLLLNKMDKRLYDYLLKKIKLNNNNPVKISHNKIANELGTAREVITRVLKKLETDGKVNQTEDGIKIIGKW